MKRPHVVILGAGISGLTLAWALRKKWGASLHLTVVDRQDRVGGWIRTRHEGGFLFECGPRGLRPSLPLLSLIEELGLQQEMVAADPVAKRRFLRFKGRLEPFPQNLLQFIRSPLTRPLLPHLLAEWRRPRGTDEESIDAFFRRRLGAHAAEILAGALTRGIFAGDPKRLSAAACFPELVALEQRHGSLTKALLARLRRPARQGMRTPLVSFKAGMEVLPLTLQRRTEAVWLLGEKIARIEALPEGLRLQGPGGSIMADRLFCCLPAYALAELLPESDLSQLLRAIEFLSLTLVHLGYDEAAMPFNGFGYLVPPGESHDLLGVVFDSQTFPHQISRSGARLTAMLPYTPQGAAALALKAVREDVHLSALPCHVHTEQVQRAVPQYTLGHRENREAARQAAAAFSDRLTLLGNSYDSPAVPSLIAAALAVAQDYS